MNLPNYITVSRIFSVPILLWLLTSNVMTDWTAGKKWWAFETVQAALAGAVGLAIYFAYRLYRGRAS